MSPVIAIVELLIVTKELVLALIWRANWGYFHIDILSLESSIHPVRYSNMPYILACIFVSHAGQEVKYCTSL